MMLMLKSLWEGFKRQPTIIKAGIIVGIIYLLYRIVSYFRRSSSDSDFVKLDYPTGGSGIPQGWSPKPVADQLEGAMSGWGTSDEQIWNALGDLNDDQLAAVYNAFGVREGTDLFGWFQSDLSGSDLQRAMDYFKNVPIDKKGTKQTGSSDDGWF